MSESKFTPLWGDLVQDLKKAEVGDSDDDEIIVEKKSTSKEGKKEENKNVVEDGSTKEVVTVSEEDKNTEAGETKPSGKTTTVKKESEEEYEYTEDDISKAYTMLLEEDVLKLNEDEEFDNSTKGIADAVAATIRKGVSEELSKTPSVVQSFYNHIVNGKDAEEFDFSAKKTWETADISDEDTQKDALLQFYKNQGMSEDDAQEEVEDVVLAGKLEKKAISAHSALIKLEQKQAEDSIEAKSKASADAQKESEANIEKIKNSIDDLEELAGFKLTSDTRKNFKSYLFDIKKRTGKTQLQENMVDEDRKMRIAFLDYVDYNKADMEKVIKSDLTKKRTKKLTRFTDTQVKNKNNSAVVKTNVTNKGKIVFPTIFGPSTIEVED